MCVCVVGVCECLVKSMAQIVDHNFVNSESEFLRGFVCSVEMAGNSPGDKRGYNILYKKKYVDIKFYVTVLNSSASAMRMHMYMYMYRCMCL